MKKILIDTNLLLDGFEINNEHKYILLSHVNRELDKHKLHGDAELKFKSRRAVRLIEENSESFDFDIRDYTVTFNDDADNNYTDNKIVQACLDNGYSIATKDLLLKQKAKMYGIEYVDITGSYKEDGYRGYKEVLLTDDERAYLYEHLNENVYNLLVNEYLIVKSENGDEIDCLKWNGRYHYETSKNTNLSTIQLGKFKALDLHQRAAIDSLNMNDVTLLRGRAGSGKSLIALTYAIHQLEKGKISRLVCLVNPVPVMNAQAIGFYKGDKNDKLLQSGIGNILISKIGDRSVVEAMIATGKLVLIPVVDIRGYDSQDDSLLWVTEAQNLSKDLMKLILQRVAKGSKCIIDGDDKAQVDNMAFAGSNNGIRRMSEIFRGEKLYGEVEFSKIYRSEIAEIADRM